MQASDREGAQQLQQDAHDLEFHLEDPPEARDVDMDVIALPLSRCPSAGFRVLRPTVSTSQGRSDAILEVKAP
ncbi:hypothetical protein EVG20_g10642 [Dentipellis fragilis]|uniref:Uncharacterized protein n=1 Tax=Dentipellis fragilis TaxID=205917 RepID=A0A4Y9XR43_9AGAM|nr:hypothetical protein EVG20_g10642 [Dentipellis fragilis]